MKNDFILMSFILTLLTTNTVFADSNYNYQNQQPQYNNQYIQQPLQRLPYGERTAAPFRHPPR